MVSETNLVREPNDGLRERHKQERRRAIVRAVRELLREDASQKLTKEAIAERADVAPATVYNLVGTRTQLLSALAEDFMQEVESRLSELPPRDPLRRARRVVELTCDVILEDPVVYAGLVRGRGECGLVLRPGPIGDLIEALAEAQAQQAPIAEADVRRLASSIASACTGAVHQWASGLIDARGFRARCVFSVDLVLAAAASPGKRKELTRVLHKRRSVGDKER
jgi:AcrR family transcriptional regulator